MLFLTTGWWGDYKYAYVFAPERYTDKEMKSIARYASRSHTDDDKLFSYCFVIGILSIVLGIPFTWTAWATDGFGTALVPLLVIAGVWTIAAVAKILMMAFDHKVEQAHKLLEDRARAVIYHRDNSSPSHAFSTLIGLCGQDLLDALSTTPMVSSRRSLKKHQEKVAASKHGRLFTLIDPNIRACLTVTAQAEIDVEKTKDDASDERTAATLQRIEDATLAYAIRIDDQCVAYKEELEFAANERQTAADYILAATTATIMAA